MARWPLGFKIILFILVFLVTASVLVSDEAFGNFLFTLQSKPYGTEVTTILIGLLDVFFALAGFFALRALRVEQTNEDKKIPLGIFSGRSWFLYANTVPGMVLFCVGVIVMFHLIAIPALLVMLFEKLTGIIVL